MQDKLGRYSLKTYNGLIKMINYSKVLKVIDEFPPACNRNLSSQRSFKSQLMASKWLYNPTEETHKNLPYPY